MVGRASPQGLTTIGHHWGTGTGGVWDWSSGTWYARPQPACKNEATPYGESPEAIRPETHGHTAEIPNGHTAESPEATRLDTRTRGSIQMYGGWGVLRRGADGFHPW